MKHIKIAAGLAHVSYARIIDRALEADRAGVDYIHSDAADMYDYEKATVEFYKKLTELYPNKEILAVSPLWRGDDGLNPERFSWCVEIVKRECKRYKNITPVDGFTLVPHVYECFCDKLHPNAYGCLLLATNLHREMKRVGF